MHHLKKSDFGPACLALLLLHSAAFAQISFTTSSIARPGEPAPVPAQLVQVSSPSVNDSGQMAYLGDGAVLLQSQGAQDALYQRTRTGGIRRHGCEAGPFGDFPLVGRRHSSACSGR